MRPLEVRVFLYMEVWKDIKGYEGYYQVSNLGNVKSLDREFTRKNGRRFRILGKHLTGVKNARGYTASTLCIRGCCKEFKIHQLVAMAFLNHMPDKTQRLVVDHINNIKSDNRLVNLQVITQRENASKDRKDSSSKYTGVFWHKAANKWMSQIVIDKKPKYLGLFTCELEAHKAYQEELLKTNNYD